MASWVLADVGGTNVRFAWAGPSGAPQDIRRFENDDYASFEAALAVYETAVGIGAGAGLCIAVAGPVMGTRARLTNRDWSFDAVALSAARKGVSVHLINDLSALGYALADLEPADIETVLDADQTPLPQEQRLVVGVGTGLNVSPVVTIAGQVTCLRAEAGLASLPTRVHELMVAYLGYAPDWAFCVENALSGAGLARLHLAASGVELADGRAVSEAAEAGDVSAQRSLDVFAQMLATMVQDLRLHYMPAQGIYLAGSVMRSVLQGPSRHIFVQGLAGQPTEKSVLPPVPVALITRDEAALLGCLAYARAMV
jgi:glucokinase